MHTYTHELTHVDFVRHFLRLNRALFGARRGGYSYLAVGNRGCRDGCGQARAEKNLFCQMLL